MQYHTKQCSTYPVMHTIRHTALIHHRHLPALRLHHTSHRCWRLSYVILRALRTVVEAVLVPGC